VVNLLLAKALQHEGYDIATLEQFTQLLQKMSGRLNVRGYPDLYFDGQGGAASVSGLPPLKHQGNGGFYFLLDQMVYRPGEPESRRGLIPFVSLLFAPDTSINTMPFFVNGGLVYRGPFASRPRDRAAFGVVYGEFSNELARSQRAVRRAGSAVVLLQSKSLLAGSQVSSPPLSSSSKRSAER